MIDQADYFKHTRSSYERPNFEYRCGRERHWQKPCHQGPRPDGSCGGTGECTPFKKGDRYECRRPLSAGGACAGGPRADGSCSQSHPPCTPQPTLRVLRARLVLFAASLAITFLGIILFFSQGRSETFVSLIDPGPLTAKHAKFAEEFRCASCHTVHNASKEVWIKSLLTPHDFTNQCMNCHAFGGPERKAHNAIFPARPDLEDTSCLMCHTEHRGINFNIKKLSDGQCNTCHQVKFDSFSNGHPPFRENFPHAARTSIQFDHVSHWNRHFKNPSAAQHAPQSCTACHSVQSKTQRDVKTGSFEQNCASCHAAEISKRDFVFFRLPQFNQGLDWKLVSAACGPFSGQEPAPPSAVSAASSPPAAFESISTEEPTAAMAFLMELDSSDPVQYTEPVRKLLLAVIQNGSAPFQALLDKRAGISSHLLGGLNPEVLKRAACDWARNQEHESEIQGGFHGWHAEALELKYQPTGHADPVIRSWMDFVAALPASADKTSQSRREAAQKDFFKQVGGVGSCAKCHALSTQGKTVVPERLSVEWKFRPSASHPRMHFSHGVHVNLLGGTGEACLKCHVMDAGADYASSFESLEPAPFVGNFSAIKKETCMQCHGAEAKTQAGSRVRQDCLLCHTYHLEPRVVKMP